jgi:hypothetical protein
VKKWNSSSYLPTENANHSVLFDMFLFFWHQLGEVKQCEYDFRRRIQKNPETVGCGDSLVFLYFVFIMLLHSPAATLPGVQQH